MSVIIRECYYYIERSTPDRPLLPDGSAGRLIRSHGMRLGPDSSSLRYGARVGVSSGDRGCMGGCMVGGMDRGGMGVMLGVMSSVTMLVVMRSVMVSVMTSRPVTEGEADKGCYEDDAEHVDTVMVRT